MAQDFVTPTIDYTSRDFAGIKPAKLAASSRNTLKVQAALDAGLSLRVVTEADLGV